MADPFLPKNKYGGAYMDTGTGSYTPSSYKPPTTKSSSPVYDIEKQKRDAEAARKAAQQAAAYQAQMAAQKAREAQQKALQEQAAERARREALDAQAYNQYYGQASNDQYGSMLFPKPSDVLTQAATMIGGYGQLPSQEAHDAMWNMGGLNYQPGSLLQSQAMQNYDVLYGPRAPMNRVQNAEQFALPDMRYQWDLEQREKPRDYFDWFYHGDQTRPELMDYQLEREQYKPGAEPWGGVGIEETPSYAYPAYDYGGYEYPQYSYPDYGGGGNYSSKPTIDTGIGQSPRSWYEKMLKWNI